MLALGLILAWSLVSFNGAFFSAARAQESLPLAGREFQPETVHLPAETAPGYCAVSGGSTSYEYISDVSWEAKSDGVFLLTVQVFIANPTGCVYGQPCQAYDSSPEYVNAWVDWNENQVWEPAEKVMDKALTGYAGINYRGTMTAIAQVVAPANLPTNLAAVTEGRKWLRTNVGYSLDPDDPCLETWSYGNAVDKPIEDNMPKIKQIIVTNASSSAVQEMPPLTDLYVKMEALLEVSDAYEVVKVKWNGPGVENPGEGNPYSEDKHKAGDHGLKTIQATLYYRNKATGQEGNTALEHTYKLFFAKYSNRRATPPNVPTSEKYADADRSNEVDWLQYWGRDGAVPGLKVAGLYPVIFDPSEPDYGGWSATKKQIVIGPATLEGHGARVISSPENCRVTTGTGAGIHGLAEVVAHERYHESIWREWYINGTWTIGTTADSDDTQTPTDKADNSGDSLPDDYETNVSHTDPNQNDSCNVKQFSDDGSYAGYGDNEFMAMKASVGKAGLPEKDWAFPGKQTTPGEMVTVAAEPVERKASGLVTEFSGVQAAGSVLAGMATLTGVYTDSGADSNGDGKFEVLRVMVGVNVLTPTRYALVGWLRDSNGVDFIWADHRLELAAGPQQIDLDFDAKLLNLHGVNGPYTLRRVEVRVGEHPQTVAFAEDAHTTAAYATANFTPPAVTFSGAFANSPADTDGDGLYNLLNINVGVQVNAPGSYVVSGWLYDATGNPVPGGSAEAAFTASGSHLLAFDGKSIRWARANGPYTLRQLEVRNAAFEPIVFNANAYTTTAYTFTQFQGASNAAEIGAGYSDQGVDINNDGSFDYLRVTMQINVVEAGAYDVEAWLNSGERVTVASAESRLNLSAGNNAVTLDFPGGPLRASGINGPYQVTGVLVTNGAGETVDFQKEAHTTQTYAHTSFALPLVAVTNSYRDYAADSNGDQVNDYLNIDVGIRAGNDGVVILQGRLVDASGQNIQSVENNIQLTAGVAQSVTLPFSATLIAANGRNGPYQLRNLLAYHTGDPAQLVSIANAHTTAAYQAQDLDVVETPGDSTRLFLSLLSKNPAPDTASCTPGPAGESNNVADAITICSDQQVTGQVSSDDRDDVYRIFGEEGDQLTITLQGTGGDADLYLYAPNTGDINADAYYTRSIALGNTEFVQITLPTPGYWIVDVYAFSGTIDYTLTTTLLAPGSAAQAPVDAASGVDKEYSR